MFKKVIVLFILLAAPAFGFNPNTDESLLGWWPLNDGAGTTAVDASGNGNDGTLEGDPEWVDGWLGGAVYLDGDDYVDTGNTENLTEYTIAIWVKSPDAPDGDQPSGPLHRENNYQINWDHNDGNYQGSAAMNAGGWMALKFGTLEADTWYHLASTFDGTNWITYQDGEQVNSAVVNAEPSNESNSLKLGRHAANGSQYFTGTVDDARVYRRALTADEIIEVMVGGLVPGVASNPYPADKTDDIALDVVLNWASGEFVVADGGTHNVYFGTDINDVNDGTALMIEGLDANTYDPGILEFGTTYYWRIDEVNDSADATVYTGSIWSFTTEPFARKIPFDSIMVEASSQESENEDPNNTINESGLDPNAMDLHANDTTGMWSTDDANSADPAWIQYDFSKVYKLHQMLVWNYNGQSLLAGFGIKDVNIQYSEDGENWTQLTGTTQFAKATGKAGYEYNTTVDFNGISVKAVKINAINNWGGPWYPQFGLSEVRFLYIPVRAREPYPDDMNDVPIDVIMTWRAGRDSVEHTVSYSTDEQAVIDGTVGSETIAQTSYGPLSLDLSQDYYWQVDSVGTSDTWEGDIWSFRTEDYTVVEDFEFYDDDDPNRVWDYWGDGWDDDNNGSTMGYPDPDFDNDEHFVETVNVYGGDQAGPIFYDNSDTTLYSEVSIDTADLPIGTNWTSGSPETLVMWFFGDVNNTPDLMYVKLNNQKVYYDGDPIHLTQSVWRPCIIDIAEFGVSLGNITSLAIGFDRAGDPGVESMLLVDDITLYRVAPEIPEAVEPSTEGLVAYYAMENNVNDSSGNGHNGTVLGAPTYVDGISGYGMAMEFSADSNDCIDLGDSDAFDPAGSFSISVWAYIKAWSTDWGDVMVSNRGEDNLGWQLRRHNSDSICFTTRGVGADDMASEIDAPLFEWVQIVCVYDNDANTKRLYIDGILDSEVDTDEGETIAAATQNVYIGARALSSNDGVDSYFTGILDEVRIYDRALS